MNLDEIMQNSEDGQVYTLLFKTFRCQMERILHDFSIDKEQHYDFLMDFFLFLRDDKKGPFQALKNMRKKNNPVSQAQWLRVVFRRYLIRHYVGNIKESDAPFDERCYNIEDSNSDTQIYSINDLRTALRLLDRVNRTYPAPERVVFFSYLDSTCSNQPADQQKLLSLLGCTAGNLRVIRYRVLNKVRQTLKEVEQQP